MEGPSQRVVVHEEGACRRVDNEKQQAGLQIDQVRAAKTIHI